MNHHVLTLADCLVQYETTTLKFREAAKQWLYNKGVSVHGVVMERREGNIYIALWLRGTGSVHAADVPLVPFRKANLAPFANLVLTQTELVGEDKYETLYLEYSQKRK